MVQVLKAAISLAKNRSFSHWKPLLFPSVASIAFEEVPEPDGIWFWAHLLVSLALYAILALTTHRLVLLGKGAVPKYGFGVWGRRETLFFTYMIFIELGILFVALIPAALAAIFFSTLADSYLAEDRIMWAVIGLSVVGIAVAIYLGSRICLVLPATSVDERLFFSGSWKLSKNHQVTMLLIFGVIPFSLEAPGYLLYDLNHRMADLIANVLISFGLIFGIALISLAYRYLKNQREHT